MASPITQSNTEVLPGASEATDIFVLHSLLLLGSYPATAITLAHSPVVTQFLAIPPMSQAHTASTGNPHFYLETSSPRQAVALHT